MKRRNLYREIETGLVMTFGEMCELLETKYDFDDFTPWSEVWNYFERA